MCKNSFEELQMIYCHYFQVGTLARGSKSRQKYDVRFRAELLTCFRARQTCWEGTTLKYPFELRARYMACRQNSFFLPSTPQSKSSFYNCAMSNEGMLLILVCGIFYCNHPPPLRKTIAIWLPMGSWTENDHVQFCSVKQAIWDALFCLLPSNLSLKKGIQCLRLVEQLVETQHLNQI